MHKVLKTVKNKLVVSCQALENEPLHSSFIMGRMAKAAVMGGAAGIRANSVADISEIQQQVEVPIIGIIKADYQGSDVFITPTRKEVNALLETGVEIIAMDGTAQKRPRETELKHLVEQVRKYNRDTLLMADVSTLEEAINAQSLGFDMVSTTLVGYTSYTKGKSLYENDFELIRQMSAQLNIPVVAEGKISDPALAQGAIHAGALFAVVGSAITRPQEITKRFTENFSSTD